MSDYKNTLNLPKTSFPMKANLAQREPQFLQYWDDINLYQKLVKDNKNKKTYIYNDGPPYANGDIHLGHALGKILKDIIVKSKRLDGYKAPFVPGWDCHGLPIELQVEKKFGKAGKKLNPKEFRIKCREYAASQVERQRASFVRLGILADWENPYLTMDYKYQADEIRAFGEIIKNGFVIRGDKPVHWCLDCQDSLAEAEVEYQNKKSLSIDVAYPVITKISELNELENLFVVIWTTTPWTLPASEAVSANPDLNYVCFRYHRKHYIIAEILLDSTLERWGIESNLITKIMTIKGQVLADLELSHPFYTERRLPIVLGDHVTVENGTGLVHTAPAHGADDYKMGQANKLPCINPVMANGCYVSDLPIFAGQHIWKANDNIVELLKTNGNLLQESKIEHSYPHCWRHKTPIIFRATPQWFISMEKNNLRQNSLNASEQVNWYPEWGYGRFTGMLAERPDWCISRQRVWGVPMCLFIHKETGEMHPNTPEFLEKIAARIEQSGLEAWHDLKIEELLNEKDAINYIKSTDTLDIWFDSGVEHYCVLRNHSDLKFPADLYLEGSDQHRGWFQSSMLTAVAINNSAPYKNVITTGFTVDSNGRKMSKSQGNNIAPEEIIKKWGADVLRLWVASTDYHREIRVSMENFDRVSETYKRVRNTIRYLLSNLNDFDVNKNFIEINKLLLIDQWIINYTSKIQADIKQAYSEFAFHKIYQILHNYCVVALGNFYLDILKDRQYTCATNSHARRSGQTAMWYVLENLLRFIAPILSFTAEEAWQEFKKPDSIFQAVWFDKIKINYENFDLDFWQNILDIRDKVNKALELARNNGVIGSGLEAKVIIYCANSFYAELEKFENELKFLFITSEAEIKLAEQLETFEVKVEALDLKKCQRCWHRTADIDINDKYPGICGRCVTNITNSKGETRKYV